MGDYKLSKKNEKLVDLFLNTLFHAPLHLPFSPSSILILYSNQVCPFLWFLYFSLSDQQFSFSGGQVRGHLAHLCSPEWATCNKDLCCCRSVARLQTFTFTPSCPACVKKTPAGMLQWGCSSEGATFGCCHEEESHSSKRKRWEMEVTHLCFGPQTKTLRDDAAICMVTVSQQLFDERPYFLNVSKRRQSRCCFYLFIIKKRFSINS